MDYHTHHERCGHALGTIEEVIKSAIEKNYLGEIGISDHFPIDALKISPEFHKYLKIVSMSKVEFPNYIDEIKKLRQKYRDQIKVRISTEIDFSTLNSLNTQKKTLEPFLDDLDYILGAVHNIKWSESPIIIITDPLSRSGSGSSPIKEFGSEKINLEYLEKMKKLVETGFFDIIAHFDNQRFFFLPEEIEYSTTAWQKLLDLLDIIKTKGMTVEINTSGKRKGVFRQFPNDNIIKEMIQRNIPLTLGSDAHAPQYVGNGFLDFIDRAKKWGLSHLCFYEKREQKLIEI